MKKELYLLSIFLLVLVSSNVLAFTGAIGNSRITINAPINTEITRSIEVENHNDFPVLITINPTEGLAGNVILEQNNFVLQPEEFKIVQFKISADEIGTTETKLNIQFSGQSQSATLTSRITFNARELIGPPICTTKSTCRLLCRADLTQSNKVCMSDYRDFVSTCNFAALVQKENCRAQEGSTTSCIREANTQLRLCKKAASMEKTFCRSEARDVFNVCTTQFD